MLLYVLPALLLYTNFQESLQDKPYNFTPESRHVEINDGDYLLVSFNEIDNQTIFGHCYIESSTIKFDYPILARNNTDNNTETYDVITGFKPWNTTGICAFSWPEMDDTVPLKWTITAYDNKTKHNFTEEVTVTFYYNMPLYQEGPIKRLEGGSVMNLFEAGSTNLKKCSLGFGDSKVDLDIDSVKVNNEDHMFKSRLMSLGAGRCGFKIINLKKENSTELTLYAIDDNNKMYRNTMSFFATSSDFKNLTLKVFLGDSARVKCGKADVPVSEQKFCYLYNPNGDLVYQGQLCAYQLDIVTMDDLGTWTCIVGNGYTSSPIQLSTELIEKKTEYVKIFTNDTKDYYVIGCNFVNFDGLTMDYCKFTRPDEALFTFEKGGTTTNYNSLGSDFKNNICTLEILKPLREEDEGTWKCEVGGSVSSMAGAFLSVKKSTTFPYLKHITKNVRLKDGFLIDCRVPYSSDYCHIVAPNGTQYEPDNNFQVTAGICLFSVEQSTVTDDGIWKCSIAQSDGLPDEIITVEISIINLRVLYADAEASEDEEVELICNTNGVPLQYCRFVSPSGVSYTLKKDNSPSQSISYKGRGLEYGDCGIKISKVNHKDEGSWTCHISSGRYGYQNKEDVAKKIQLRVNYKGSPVALAESLGIGLGIVAAIIAIGGFIFYRYSKRRCAGGTVEEREGGRPSNESGENIILSVQQNTYNT